MRSSNSGAGWVAGVMFILLGSFTAQAEFIPIETFEGLMPGPIDNQNGWVAEDASSEVVADPLNPANQALAIVTESTHLYHSLLILEGETRMLFLRVRFADRVNLSFGMSDVTYPSRFDHFEVELSLDNMPAELRINDGGNFDFLGQLDQDRWYSCWIRINGSEDESQVWLHGRGPDSADPDDQLDSEGQTIFEFRNTTAQNLVNFYIKTGGGSGLSGPFYVDDIYIENSDAWNFENPTWTPAAVAGGEGASVRFSIGPNPFRGRTLLTLQLSDRSHQPGVPNVFTVFDPHGRLIRSLIAGQPVAGAQYSATWDGRDSQGRPVVPGVYLIRADAGRSSAASKAIVLR